MYKCFTQSTVSGTSLTRRELTIKKRQCKLLAEKKPKMPSLDLLNTDTDFIYLVQEREKVASLIN